MLEDLFYFLFCFLFLLFFYYYLFFMIHINMGEIFQSAKAMGEYGRSRRRLSHCAMEGAEGNNPSVLSVVVSPFAAGIDSRLRCSLRLLA